MAQWHEMIGRNVEVISGPLSGMSGALQEMRHGSVRLAYLDENRDVCYVLVDVEHVQPPVKEGEELPR